MESHGRVLVWASLKTGKEDLDASGLVGRRRQVRLVTWERAGRRAEWEVSEQSPGVVIGTQPQDSLRNCCSPKGL